MLGSNLAVKVDKAEEILASGLVIPEVVAKGRELSSINYGIVHAVGPKVLEVAVGDRVAFVEGTYWKNDKRINKNEFEYEGEMYLLVPEREIKAIIEG